MARVGVDLCLVRHGRTAFGATDRFCGSSDPPLDHEGKLQAHQLRVRLAPTTFDRVWSSDLQRAVETALIIDRGPPTIDPRIRELDFGNLEGKRWTECTPELQEALVAFDGFAAPGGESLATLRARVASFLAQLEPGRHLVVTHGGVIRALLADLGRDRAVDHGEIVELALGGAAQDGA